MSIFDNYLKKIISPIPYWIKPNHLTIFRIILAIILILLFINDYFISSFIIFILAAATDAIDGALARHREQITKIGAIIDPVVDKLFIIALIILFINFIPLWFIVWIIAIELAFILVGLIVYYPKNIKIEANIWGKIKMTSEVIAILLLFFKIILEINYFDNIIIFLLGAILVFAIFSAINALISGHKAGLKS